MALNKQAAMPRTLVRSKTYTVVEKAPFGFDIGQVFLPQDRSLRFEFVGKSPEWLHLSPTTGKMLGIAPKVSQNKLMRLAIMASNQLGAAKLNCILKIKTSDVVQAIIPALQLAHNLRQERYGFSHIHPYTPDLLEYIYTLYQLPDYKKKFAAALNKQLRRINESIPISMTYHEFKEKALKLNPNLEENLQHRLSNNISSLEQRMQQEPHFRKQYMRQVMEMIALAEEQMAHEQLINLFRQGSQEMGIIPVPIFNYLSAPGLYNWRDWEIVDNLLAIAAHAVARITAENKKKQTLSNPRAPKLTHYSK